MEKKVIAVSAIGVLVGGLLGIATGTPVQWKAADGGNDHLYDIVVHDTHSWSAIENGIFFKDAITAANDMGGHLATPSLSGEAGFIYDTLVAPVGNEHEQYYWMGAFCPDSGQAYRWVNGDTVTSWGGYTSIDCAEGEVPYGIVIGGTAGAALQDLPLENVANGFIVEFDAPSPVPPQGAGAQADAAPTPAATTATGSEDGATRAPPP